MNEDKSTVYHRLRRRADLLGTAAAGFVLLTLLISGASLTLREWAAVAANAFPVGLEDVMTVIALTAMLVLLLQLVELPFAFYQGHLLEHQYGLSTQPARRWLVDQGKGVALGVAVAALGASVVLLALREWPGQWWWISAAVFAAGMVGLARLAPVVLLPLFYTFKPLDRPVLAARLLALAGKARTDVVGVFEWVLSDHTRKANAALAGLGQTRRILVSDTLLAGFSEDEIEVVLAHELAHHVHRDLWRGIAVQTLLLFGGFFVADLVLRRLADAAGLRGLSDPAALPLLMLVAGAWSFLMLPLVNALSRAQERAADRYALDTTRNVDAFVTAMKRLSQQNLAEEYPSLIVRWLFYSHPPIRERIDAARAFARERDSALRRMLVAVLVMTASVGGSAQYSKKTLVAHRGASAYAPENTLASYRLAIEMGADFVEQDLQVTRDGVLICLHDASLERTTNVAKVFPERSTDIVVDGKARKTWLANDFTLAEIKRLDAGAWFNARFAGERVPTFDESVTLLEGKAGLYSELKTPEMYRSRGVDLARLVEAALDRNVLRGPKANPRTPIVLQTFSQNAAARLAQLKIGVPIVLLLDDNNTFDSIDRLRQWKGIVQGFGMPKSLLVKAPQLLNWSHASGMSVALYTFRPDAVQPGFLNVTDEMEFFLKKLGVDAVITSSPDRFPQ